MSRDSLGANPTGLALRNDMNARFKLLFDAATFPLGSVSGTADAVTATLTPDFDGDGLVEGMTFGITWAGTNTGGVTLSINGGSALAVLDASGAALAAGALESGLYSRIAYVDGDFILLTPQAGQASFGRYYWSLTVSGTWTKPTELPDDTPVYIEAIGAGGGGYGNYGGGGGGYADRMMRLGDLAPSVTYTIGAGSAHGSTSPGGDTTFGTYLTAYGGGTAGSGGYGGGSMANGSASGAGYLGGGEPASAGDPDATTENGGGGCGTTGGGSGGRSTKGGGGGGGAGGVGGLSKFAGNGGNSGESGAAPGGGGGSGGAGARGEIRIWI